MVVTIIHKAIWVQWKRKWKYYLGFREFRVVSEAPIPVQVRKDEL